MRAAQLFKLVEVHPTAAPRLHAAASASETLFSLPSVRGFSDISGCTATVLHCHTPWGILHVYDPRRVMKGLGNTR